MRVCRKCGEEKPLSEFVKSKVCRHGRSWTCRECENARGRRWKEKNSERLSARRRELYLEKYGPVNRANEERRRREHPFRVRCQRLRSGMRDRSKLFGVPFDDEVLTVPYLMDLLRRQTSCDCCGTEFEFEFTDQKMKDRAPSVDRIRSSLGYVVENIALVCWRCNRLKSDSIPEELIRIAEWQKMKLSET